MYRFVGSVPGLVGAINKEAICINLDGTTTLPHLQAPLSLCADGRLHCSFPLCTGLFLVRVNVVALGEAFYFENNRFDLDTLRVPNRSPTPISKSKNIRGQYDDIWGARGPHFRPILGDPGVRAGLTNT